MVIHDDDNFAERRDTLWWSLNDRMSANRRGLLSLSGASDKSIISASCEHHRTMIMQSRGGIYLSTMSYAMSSAL